MTQLLQKFKENGYFTADLYHLLANKKFVDTSEEIIPSEYDKEIRMRTEDRLQTLHNIEVENIIGDDKSKAVLSFAPRLILFQNFKLNEKVVAQFSIKNISKAPTYVNMVYKESSHFFIKPSGGQLLSRLAPGISVTFCVTFQPDQYKDYTHQVTFHTDVYQYVLPLIAMGPRPLFNFPDQVVLSTGPLKVENYLMLTVQNVGMVPAGFTLMTKSPFSVQPKSTYLNPNEKVEIQIEFKTMFLGETKGVLNAILETGENFRINIIGSTHLVNVELEKQVVRFPDTYNTMLRQQNLKIINKSNYLLTYACMKNDCVYNDFEDKVKLVTIFYNVKEKESAKSNKLVHYDILSSDEHERVYTRIFYDEIQALVADESLFFKNSHFSISPISGKIWPKNSTELTITFAPNEIGEFETTAYLDIDGVNDRIPLKMIGTSLPPLISLNLETLHMDRVYINKMYNYEIVAKNQGHINGTIVYKEEPPLFGSIILCKPMKRCLRPGDMDIFVISFSNSNKGPFFEEISFSILDTDVILKVYLKGIIEYPSLTFSLLSLDFGMVSLGVPKTLLLEVTNESTMQVDASVKIPSDGPEISSITLKDYAVADKPKPHIPQCPREFHIEPNKISVGPETQIVLKVTLTPNLVRANQTYLELELDKSDSPSITLPVTFNAMVPQIIPAPDINLTSCCLDFPYKQELSIRCEKFWGYFTVVESQEQSPLVINVEVKEGFIEPNSNLNVPITIKTSDIGHQEYTLRLNIFGLSKPVEVCHITAVGVQPRVTCSPTALHWGQVKLLTRNQKVLTLCNDSPVVIHFKASLLHNDGRWNISPIEGDIGSDNKIDLTLNLYLIDADIYSNKAIIQMEKVNDLIVPLTATGVGTSIVVGEYGDRINLGKHFTNIPLESKIIMENRGTRMHALEWTKQYKGLKSKQLVTVCFALEPNVFKMSPGEKLELTITSISHKVTTINEMWYLVGCVEGINKKEILLECQIFTEFVDPKIELSPLTVDFRYDLGPYNEYYKLTDIVTIKNISKLPLDLEINTKPPFAIIQKRKYKTPFEENLCSCICYDKFDLNLPNIVNKHGQNRSRIFIDCLTPAPVDVRKKNVLNFFEDINKIKLVFNLTNKVEEQLEDQEVMKLQVLFDTSRHTSLKSRVYCDSLKIKFKGHRNKDAITLVGKINYPNITALTTNVDFQCVLNNSVESKTIKIQNMSPLLVCYKFKWKNYFIKTEPMQKIFLQSLPGDKSNLNSQRCSIKTDLLGLNEVLSPRTPDASVLYEIEYDNEDNSNIHTVKPNDVVDDANLANKVMKRIAPIINAACDPKFQWTNKLSHEAKRDSNYINEILQLVPHRGLLRPNEIHYVHFIFKPTNNVHIRALLQCDVLGGPSEYISINGQSSDLSYAISSKNINYKICSFHKSVSEKLILSNKAPLSFQYNTYFNEPTYENDLYMTILDITPNEKHLKENEEIEIVIEIKSGVMGHFKKTFLLEVGHLPCIPIEIFGWGVIPQVYLNLPRPEMSKSHLELGYRAISTLTREYLDAINEIFVDGSSRHLNSPFTEECLEDHLCQENWYICSIWEQYPSVMDIELAIERLLVMNYMEQHPDVLYTCKTSKNKIPIRGFHTTPYLLDFGVVITGTKIQVAVNIINYGPITTKINIAKDTNIPVWLSIKFCGKLNPGENGKLEITFSPDSNDFKELEQNVEVTFNLEVPYGVSIPIQMKALCAVPYLCTSVKTINFGSVKCGDKIIHSIPLKNIGRPICVWYASLKVKTQGPNPMTILTTSGKFKPGVGGLFSIAFKPTMEMDYEALLIFKFHMNPNRLTIPVFGKGILPQIHVIGSNVKFPPTLPFAETTYMYFGLTNPCPFPIELIFAHNDTKWKEEEEIYQLLYKYYNEPEEILVPVLRPAIGLPQQITSFYSKYKEAVQSLKGEQSFQVSKTVTHRTSSGETKSKPSMKSILENEAISPKKFRSDAEIDADVIKTMKEDNLDPLRDCLYAENNIVDKCNARQSKGILIMFHGSPCEEMKCQEIAYSTGKLLSLPTVNIDNSIVEALCTCTGAAKLSILSAVNEFYASSRKSMTNFDSGDHETDQNYMVEETDNEFDLMWKKIKLFVHTKGITSPRSKISKKKKKRSLISSTASQSALGSTTIFQLELIQELLTEFFKQPKYDKGFVVDTLTSIIIKSPPLVLTTVLKCKHTIWNIHLVLCQSDFNKWAESYQEAQRVDLIDEHISKVYEKEEIVKIIDDFEELNDSEYEAANPELRQMYIEYGLESRRKKFYESKGYFTDARTKDKIIPGIDHSKSLLNVKGPETKKKIIKEEIKGKPTSEYLTINTKYNNYVNNVYENLIRIANNWIIEECEIGHPLLDFSGQVMDSTRRKVKKKSEVQTQTFDKAFPEKGFPLTIIMQPCLLYKNAILNMFARSIIVQEALKKEEAHDILKLPISRKEFSVLLPKIFPVLSNEDSLQWKFLDERPIKKCECNQITDLSIIDDSNQDNVLYILSKWHCTCGKRVNSLLLSYKIHLNISYYNNT